MFGTIAAITHQRISQLAEKAAKEIRHMDRIDYDPEGQRIKKIISEVLLEMMPKPDDNKTTHVTKAPEEHVPAKASQTLPTTNVGSSYCHKCQHNHISGTSYDHAPVPLIRG